MGCGTAWGGHLVCTQKISWVRFPDGPQTVIEGKKCLDKDI